MQKRALIVSRMGMSFRHCFSWRRWLDQLFAGAAENEFGFYLDLDRACQDDAASSFSEILRSLAGSVKCYVY
jgi:hypothetical protein